MYSRPSAFGPPVAGATSLDDFEPPLYNTKVFIGAAPYTGSNVYVSSSWAGTISGYQIMDSHTGL